MALKDELIIYIDSDPNGRITAINETLFWRHDLTYYTIHPITNEMTKIDVPFIKDKKYEVPFYKDYKFLYSNLDETWIKLSDGSTNTGWKFVRYAAPTLGSGVGPVPPPAPTPTPTPATPCCSGSVYCGVFTGSFVIETVTNSNMTGNFYIISGSSSGSGSGSYTGLIGLPTSQSFYGASEGENAADLQEGDRVEDAFNKVDIVLGKLIPPIPPNLSSKTLVLASSYSARMASVGTVYSNVTNNTSPLVVLNGGMVPSNAFYDGDKGTLTGFVNGVSVGSCSLTTGSDVGTYGALTITSDADFYVGQVGKQGFWNALLAQVVANVGTSFGPHTVRMTHSRTGTTLNLQFFIDDPITPYNVNGTVSASGISYISGVPTLVGGANNAAISFSGSADGTVGRFYNTSGILTFGGTGLGSLTIATPTPAPLSGSTQTGNGTILLNIGTTSENASFTVTARNSIGTTTTTNITNTHIRMDSTLDNRVSSGVGQYPTVYGSSFNPATSLATAGNEELQMLNGQYRYPTGSYTSAVPVSGPDYTSVPNGSYSSMRWVTFNLGSGTNFKNAQLTFNNSSNFDFGSGDGHMLNFALYVRVDGSTPTNGWVDGNSAYLAGNPTNNGDAALSVAFSSATVKMITFGSAVKTGNVIVRVGIPTGNNRRFGSISMTLS